MSRSRCGWRGPALSERYVAKLQVPGQVARFLHDHPGFPLPSPALFERIGNRFRGAVRRFAEDRDIPILRLK